MTHRGPAEWKAHVYGYRGPGVGNGVRLLLVLMADHMDDRRNVSVPRSRLADMLGISRREVAGRLAAAKEAGLLDAVQTGRPGVTAVYQGLFPVAGDHGVPKQDGDYGVPTDGDHGVPTKAAVHGSGNPPMQPPEYGDPVVRASSKSNHSKIPGYQQTAPRGELTAPQGEDGQPAEQAPGFPLMRPGSKPDPVPIARLPRSASTGSGSAGQQQMCPVPGCREPLRGVAVGRGICGAHWLSQTKGVAS